MIFIGGISNGVKELVYNGSVYCRRCGRREAVAVYMTYMYFSFFFIPIFKWGRRFFVEFQGCRGQYELDKEKGMRILHGEEVEILPGELSSAGGNGQAAYGGQAYGASGNRYAENKDAAYENARGGDASARIFGQSCGAVSGSAAESEPAGSDAADRRYCPHCGEEIEVKFEYCPYCGGKL